MYKKLIFGLSLLMCATVVHAGAIDQLKAFISGTRSAQAEFTQEVFDRNGKRVQSASGTLRFVRPGKFRWEYRKPYEQLIVGDGKKFWMYDVDLEQVTVRNLDAALGSSPAALLSGGDEIERGFVLEEVAPERGLEWLRVTPKNAESSFAAIRMGFDARSGLTTMELGDNFGGTTVLRFSGMQRNPQLAPSLFRFVPPEGVDVLEER